MEVKYYVVNPNKYEISLPEMAIHIEWNGKTEIPWSFADILIKQFEVRMVTIEKGKITEDVDYKEFLENSKELKRQTKQEKHTQNEEVIENE